MMLRLAVAAVCAIVEGPAFVGAQTSPGEAVDAVEKIRFPDPAPQRTPATSVHTLWNSDISRLQETFTGAVLGLGLGIVAVSRGLSEESGDTTLIWLGSNGVGTVGGGHPGAPVGITTPRRKRRSP